MTNKPNVMASCGGPGLCNPCSVEAIAIVSSGTGQIPSVDSESLHKLGSPENFQTKAIRIVKNHIDSGFVGYSEKPAYELFIVWYSKTLQNWKALVSTTLPDHMYYEVTYNGDKRETYLNAYVKTANVCIPD